MKAKTMIIGHDGSKKINEGDYVIAIQGNKNGEEIMVNMDWSFAKDVSVIELKSMIGGLLGNLEDLYGEKFITEVIAHHAEETGKMVKAPGGKVAYFRSKEQEFKK